jgi:hypothetical protein
LNQCSSLIRGRFSALPSANGAGHCHIRRWGWRAKKGSTQYGSFSGRLLPSRNLVFPDSILTREIRCANRRTQGEAFTIALKTG